MGIEIQQHKLWNIGEHKIIIDASIIEVLKITYLHLKEFKKVAIEIDKRISNIGYAVPAESVLLIYNSSIPNPDNFLAGQVPIKPVTISGITVTSVINIFPTNLKEEVARRKDAVAVVEKKKRKKTLKDMLRAAIGVLIAHEITHSFGIGLMNKRLEKLDILELELLADSIALLSSLDIFGNDAYLGATYIQNIIDRSIPIHLYLEKSIEFAKSTVAKYTI